MPGALPLCACEVVLPPRPLPKSSTGSAGDRRVPERERQLQDARDQPDTCKGKEEGRVQEPAKASGRDTPERRGQGRKRQPCRGRASTSRRRDSRREELVQLDGRVHLQVQTGMSSARQSLGRLNDALSRRDDDDDLDLRSRNATSGVTARGMCG